MSGVMGGSFLVERCGYTDDEQLIFKRRGHKIQSEVYTVHFKLQLRECYDKITDEVIVGISVGVIIGVLIIGLLLLWLFSLRPENVDPVTKSELESM